MSLNMNNFNKYKLKVYPFKSAQKFWRVALTSMSSDMAQVTCFKTNIIWNNIKKNLIILFNSNVKLLQKKMN